MSEKSIAKLEAERAELDALIAKKKKALAELTPEQAIATQLHNTTCRANHTDQCSWCYEDWKKPGHARKRYLEAGKKLKLRCDAENIDVQVALGIIEEFRYV